MFGSRTSSLSVLFHAATVFASCAHNTRLHRRQEGAIPELPTFGYTDDLSAPNWAGLDPANIACATGQTQSPINLTPTTAQVLGAPPIVDYPPVQSAEFENLGTTIEVIVNGSLQVQAGGEQFQLKQFHMHTPSEHRINDEYFPLELHMVHENPETGNIAVVALLFEMSDQNTQLFDTLVPSLPQIQTAGTVTNTGAIDFAPVAQHITTTPLLTYQGSLTTPPCAEGLTFLVTQQPLPINVATYNAIKKTIKFNARYTQNPPGDNNILALGCDSTLQVLGGDQRLVAPPPPAKQAPPAEQVPPVEQAPPPPVEVPPMVAPPVKPPPHVSPPAVVVVAPPHDQQAKELEKQLRKQKQKQQKAAQKAQKQKGHGGEKGAEEVVVLIHPPAPPAGHGQAVETNLKCVMGSCVVI